MLEQYEHLSTEIGFLKNSKLILRQKSSSRHSRLGSCRKEIVCLLKENLAHDLALTIDSKRFDAEQKLHAAYMHALGPFRSASTGATLS